MLYNVPQEECNMRAVAAAQLQQQLQAAQQEAADAAAVSIAAEGRQEALTQELEGLKGQVKTASQQASGSALPVRGWRSTGRTVLMA
jgi:hypothetical protein